MVRCLPSGTTWLPRQPVGPGVPRGAPRPQLLQCLPPRGWGGLPTGPVEVQFVSFPLLQLTVCLPDAEVPCSAAAGRSDD